MQIMTDMINRISAEVLGEKSGSEMLNEIRDFGFENSEWFSAVMRIRNWLMSSEWQRRVLLRCYQEYKCP